jgi:serine/threonine protein kinase
MSTMLRVPDNILCQVNIFISRSHRACLADFGLATVIIDASLALMTSTPTHRGSLRWQAPELFADNEQNQYPTQATDVYAFALVCYEASHIRHLSG